VRAWIDRCGKLARLRAVSPIHGIYVPTITPYASDGKLNESELRGIIEWLIGKGITGLYPNGSMGEFIRLSQEERKRLITIIADQARGRVPILAGAAEPNIDLVLDMCNCCADLGCRAVSISGPYFYKISQENIEHYFRQIAAKSPIDIIICNIPPFANEISVPVMKRLAMDCPRIVGTLDASKDMCRFLHVLNEIKPQRPDFSVLIGWEELLVPALMMGCDGGTISTAGVAPEAIMKIYQAALAGDWAQAKRMQFKLLELFTAMLSAGNFPEGFRTGYELRGFAVGPARQPLSPHEAAELKVIRERIACLLAEGGFSEAADECRSCPPPKPSFDGVSTISPHGSAPAFDIDAIVRSVMANLGN
jgi:dihydrodipicolinate synthase/N-acetylneuraminate lyase